MVDVIDTIAIDYIIVYYLSHIQDLQQKFGCQNLFKSISLNNLLWNTYSRK